MASKDTVFLCDQSDQTMKHMWNPMFLWFSVKNIGYRLLVYLKENKRCVTIIVMTSSIIINQETHEKKTAWNSQGILC